MRAIINRVTGAKLLDGDKVIAETGVGYFISLGITDTDTRIESEKLASKITAVRSYRTTTGDLDIHLKDICGQILVVPDPNVVASMDGGEFTYTSPSGEKLRELYSAFIDFFTRDGLRCVGVPEPEKSYDVSAELNGVVTYVIDTVNL